MSHVTVYRIVERLQTEGLAEPYQPVALSAAGKRLAARCRERYEVVVRFLVAIVFDTKSAAVDAEGIEHHGIPRALKCF